MLSSTLNCTCCDWNSINQHVNYICDDSALDLSAAFLASWHFFLFELSLSCLAICSLNLFLLLIVGIFSTEQPWTLQHISFIWYYFKMKVVQSCIGNVISYSGFCSGWFSCHRFIKIAHTSCMFYLFDPHFWDHEKYTGWRNYNNFIIVLHYYGNDLHVILKNILAQILSPLSIWF